MKNKERKKDRIIEQILNQRKEYSSRKHLIEIKRQPLSDEEIKEWIKSINQMSEQELNWISRDYDEIKIELKKRAKPLEQVYLDGTIPATVKKLTAMKLSITKRLYERYKSLSRKEISTAKRVLTLVRDELEINIYKKCAYRQETLDKVVPPCIEYLETEYQKYYDILDGKTEAIKENQTTVKKEIEMLEKEKII